MKNLVAIRILIVKDMILSDILSFFDILVLSSIFEVIFGKAPYKMWAFLDLKFSERPPQEPYKFFVR